MLNSSRQFNNAVHALRALAVLMVFAVHLLDSFSTYFFPGCETLNVAMPFIKRFGTFGVELFFVISGFVIMNSVRKYDLREFLLRRLIRIYPLFASFTLAFFVLSWITNFHSLGAVRRVGADRRDCITQSGISQYLFWNSGPEPECLEPYFRGEFLHIRRYCLLLPQGTPDRRHHIALTRDDRVSNSVSDSDILCCRLPSICRQGTTAELLPAEFAICRSCSLVRACCNNRS